MQFSFKIYLTSNIFDFKLNYFIWCLKVYKDRSMFRVNQKLKSSLRMVIFMAYNPYLTKEFMMNDNLYQELYLDAFYVKKKLILTL